MKPQNQVTVRSSETGLVFRMNRTVAERHDTLTILDGSEAVEAEESRRLEDMSYDEVRAEVRRRNKGRDDDQKIPAVGTQAELIAALVADDNQ